MLLTSLLFWTFHYTATAIEFGLTFPKNLIQKVPNVFQFWLLKENIFLSTPLHIIKLIANVRLYNNYFLHWTFAEKIWFVIFISSQNFSVECNFFYTNVRENKRFTSNFFITNVENVVVIPIEILHYTHLKRV